MSDFLNQQLTNVGWDALSTALGGGRLTFFKMQAGDGTIADDTAIPGMVGLVHPVCDIALVKYEIDGKGTITLFGNIASSTIDVGFTFRELGVFATIEQPIPGSGGVPVSGVTAVESAPIQQVGNPVVPTPSVGTPLMYSYCNSYDKSDYIPGKGETTDVVNSVQVTVVIDKAANIVINIVAGQQLSVTNIGAPTIGAGPWSYTQANVAYLKRLVAGPAIAVSEDANTITIGQKILANDLDLYVAIGNPDISPNFSTLAKALNYLGGFSIPSTIKARINMSAGVYTQPTQTTVNHPDGSQISILGAAPIQSTISAITNVDANNFDVTVADGTLFKAGDEVVIPVTGDVAIGWKGSRIVNSVAGNKVRLAKNFLGGVDVTVNQTGLSTTKLTKYPVVIKCVNCSGIVSYTGLGTLNNITIIGPGWNVPIYNSLNGDISNIQGVLLCSSQVGLTIGKGVAVVKDLYINDCNYGMVAQAGGSIVAAPGAGDVCVNSCHQQGIWAQPGTNITLGTVTLSGTGKLMVIGCNTGVLASGCGAFNAGNLWTYYNNLGIQVSDNGIVSLGALATVPSNVTTNKQYDLFAMNAGFMNVAKNGGVITILSPAAGTTGNAMGYISVVN